MVVKGIKKVPMAVKTEKRTKGWLCVGGWGPLQLLRIIPATGGPGIVGWGHLKSGFRGATRKGNLTV